MFECVICNTSATSFGNLKSHFLTAKHKKKLLESQKIDDITKSKPKATRPKKGKTTIPKSNEVESKVIDINKCCKYCKKQFYSKYNADRHFDKCKVKNKIMTENSRILNDVIYNTIMTMPQQQPNIQKNKSSNSSPPDSQKDSRNNFNYVYVVAKYDLNKNRLIYKIGKTKRYFPDRMKEHGKETLMLYVSDVRDCDITEQHVLKTLATIPGISKCPDIGIEYFICDDKHYFLNAVATATLNSEHTLIDTSNIPTSPSITQTQTPSTQTINI